MKSFFRMSAVVAALSLTAVGGAAPAAAAVDMVVVHAENAPFKPGAIIDGSLPLTLKAGWSVTLVASDGSFVTLKGPSSVVPANQRSSRNSDPKLLEALRALLAAEEISTAALGVVRSADGKARHATPPSPWAVNVQQSGQRCIRSRVVTLWRPDTARSANLRIKSLGGGRTAAARWPAGRDKLRVDGAGFRNGGKYVFDLGGQRADITMHVMPAGLSKVVHQAAWMAETGCREQALALLKTIR